MFLAHIAYSLELISLAAGALLVFLSHRHWGVPDNTNSNFPNALPKKDYRGHGVIAAIGYIIIILSILGYIFTSISYFRGPTDIDYRLDPSYQRQVPAQNHLESVPTNPTTPTPSGTNLP